MWACVRVCDSANMRVCVCVCVCMCVNVRVSVLESEKYNTQYSQLREAVQILSVTNVQSPILPSVLYLRISYPGLINVRLVSDLRHFICYVIRRNLSFMSDTSGIFFFFLLVVWLM